MSTTTTTTTTTTTSKTHGVDLHGFAVEALTLGGNLPEKLEAIAAGGFTEVVLKTSDLIAVPGGVERAAGIVRASGLRPIAIEFMRDFEGLTGAAHAYKLGIARTMFELCDRMDCRTFLICSSALAGADGARHKAVADFQALAAVADGYGVRIAYEALSWATHVHDMAAAWDIVQRVDRPNFGLGIDSFHNLARPAPLADIDTLDPARIFMVQLADFLVERLHNDEERKQVARTYRVFPGEGVHGPELVEIATRLRRIGYRGSISFEVFNDEYKDLPLPAVVERARNSVAWLRQHAEL